MKVLLAFLGSILALLLIAGWRAWVVARLWMWFVVPSFAAAPPLRAWQVYGILMLIDAAQKPDLEDRKEKTTEETIKHWAVSLFYPAVVLFSGWVALTVLR